MIPHLFSKQQLPRITNKDLNLAIDQVKKQKNQEQAVKKSLEIITSKFVGYRFRTYIYFWKLFDSDPNTTWSRKGDFMHCHHQNLFLRILLVKSGWFEDSDISHGYSLVWYISPHQYLRIQMEDKIVGVDPWNQAYGARWDEHASGFVFRKMHKG